MYTPTAADEAEYNAYLDEKRALESREHDEPEPPCTCEDLDPMFGHYADCAYAIWAGSVEVEWRDDLPF